MATIFDGRLFARARQHTIQQQVQQCRAQGQEIKIVSVFFGEDPGSVLYTRLKQAAATRAGIRFDSHRFPLTESSLPDLLTKLAACAADPHITGLMVQKPTEPIWQGLWGSNAAFEIWWQKLTRAIPIMKDVDGLTPNSLSSIKQGTWTILPATVKATLLALEAALDIPVSSAHAAAPLLNGLPIVVVGCSDIIGQPLAEVLRHLGGQVTQCCDKVHEEMLRLAAVVISATGTPGIITGRMLATDSIVIDVGSPLGDVDFPSAARRAKFITPVPGGIGPLTVISLLENALALAPNQVHQSIPPPAARVPKRS